MNLPPSKMDKFYGHYGFIARSIWILTSGLPIPTGKRYCMNSASLRFLPKEGLEKTIEPAEDAEDAEEKQKQGIANLC